MRRLLAGLLVCLSFFCFGAIFAPVRADDNTLTIGLTDEEKTRLHEIGINHKVTKAPTGVVRNPAEWEPSQGVLIRWPLGIPTSLVAEMSEDVMVTTICSGASQEAAARSSYESAGVNMDHVDFIYASTNTYWVRDYGPWFIFDDLDLAIVDHIYNRPRPLDDVIPQAIGTAWGLSVHGMDLNHTGGNHMSDGLGTSISTELVYDENSTKTEAEVDQLMLDYLGNDYTVLDYIQSSGIHHIDCWAKFLSPSTILVKDVPSSDSTYANLNARAAYLATQTSAWGVPYNVVRVYCPNDTFYTNSLILNNKVLIPLFGDAQDSAALQTYQNAMPGYEVLGFTGGWDYEDALHCRTMGVPDQGMLFIDHIPFRTQDIEPGDYRIETTIIAHSGSALIASDLNIIYNVDSGTWQETLLIPDTGADQFYGYIPQQAHGSLITYYLQASDESGRTETHPFIGADGAHQFAVNCINFAGVTSVINPQEAVCAIDLTWSAAVDYCGGSISYTVYRDTISGFTPNPANLLVQDLSGTSYRDTDNLVSGTPYYYIVRAFDEINVYDDGNMVELSAAPTGPGGGSQTLFSDDFEDALDWANWTVTTGPGSHSCGPWSRVNTSNQRPPNSTGYYALTDSDACGSGETTSTRLTSPVIDCDLAGLSTVTLEYDIYYRYYNGDNASVQVFNGSMWVTIWNDPNADFQAHESYDVTSYAHNNPAFQIRFDYQNAAYDYWFAVDNVVLTGMIDAPCTTASPVITVADGTENGTVPLEIVKNGNYFDLTWDAVTSACTSADYHLIWGWGADLDDYIVSGSECTLDAPGSHLWQTAPDTTTDLCWFLIVGNDGNDTDVVEGGWGSNSEGIARKSSEPSWACNTTSISNEPCDP
ncbi:agmatine deiminase family protein [bacterium]|nr:agmatine deiminase family protein [bacterium]